MLEAQQRVNRFGMGLSAQCRGADVEACLAELAGGPETGFEPRSPQDILKTLSDIRTLRRSGGDRDALRAARTRRRDDHSAVLRLAVARGMAANIGFAERLVLFWHDHFALSGLSYDQQLLLGEFLWHTLRPHIGGRFVDLAKAALLHPLMLTALDQLNAIGPNADHAHAGRGFNENFAREMLELHLLGVNGPYAQTDITELAQLMTGLRHRRGEALRLNPRLAEPGMEAVLGRSYGGDPAKISHIEAVIEDLARHPSTERHLSWKLCRHFVADQPEADLVDHVTAAWQASDGDLTAVSAALLDHPAALAGAGKIRRPIVFMIAALRALGYPAERPVSLDHRRFVEGIERPLTQMGQRFMAPFGPDGWPEDAAAWITADRLANRLGWGLSAPRLFNRILPDPPVVADTALGAGLDGHTHFAVTGAESRPDGLALLFASPVFNRV